MSKFAKIIELDNNQQVLITLNCDDSYEIEQRTNYLGMTMKMSLGFESQERAEEVLDIYSKKDAIAFLKTLKELT